MNWERVYTINSFHDIPRLGIADYQGRPHIYQSRFDEVRDGWSEDFYVKEIDTELFALILEDYEIFLRWRKACDDQKAAIDTHPALPSDRQRHEILATLIGDRLAADPKRSKIVRAKFRAISFDCVRTEVEWSTPVN